MILKDEKINVASMEEYISIMMETSFYDEACGDSSVGPYWVARIGKRLFIEEVSGITHVVKFSSVDEAMSEFREAEASFEYDELTDSIPGRDIGF